MDERLRAFYQCRYAAVERLQFYWNSDTMGRQFSRTEWQVRAVDLGWQPYYTGELVGVICLRPIRELVMRGCCTQYMIGYWARPHNLTHLADEAVLTDATGAPQTTVGELREALVAMDALAGAA